MWFWPRVRLPTRGARRHRCRRAGREAHRFRRLSRHRQAGPPLIPMKTPRADVQANLTAARGPPCVLSCQTRPIRRDEPVGASMTGGDQRPQSPAIAWFSLLRDNRAMRIDDVLAAAVEPARRAILESADPTEVGDHLGARSEGEHLVVHLFGSRLPGYRGWYWAVSVARAPASSHVTVNEVVLLPGDESISAPEWTPYKQRVEPGDLQPGDVLPTEPNDARLVPAWSAGESDAHPGDIATAREHAFGRKVVLSRQGRLDAADRWYSGSQGPGSPLAKQAPGRCHPCRFLA